MRKSAASEGKRQGPANVGNKQPAADERIVLLGIPAAEMTESVTLALSALYEKLDDVTYELACARKDFAELEQLVDVDCIAPVPNRRAFIRRLSWAIAMHERYGHVCSVLYLDLNGFKQLNDEYGHAAGDAAIRHVSELLLSSLRQSDFMARLGGDEFAMIMYFSQIGDAESRGKKIVNKIEVTPLFWEGQQLSLGASVGAYEVLKGDSAEAALARSDKAMYADKKQRKAQLIQSAH